MHFTTREALRNWRGHLLGTSSGVVVVLAVLFSVRPSPPLPVVPSPAQSSLVSLKWGSPLAEPVATEAPLGEGQDELLSEETPEQVTEQTPPPTPQETASAEPKPAETPSTEPVADLPLPEANEIEQELKPVEELTPEQIAETTERYRGRIREGEWLISILPDDLDNEQFDTACLGYAVETVANIQGRVVVKNREYLSGRTLQKGDRSEYEAAVLCGPLKNSLWSQRIRDCFQTRYGGGAIVRVSFCLRDEVALDIYRVLLPFIQKHQPGPEHRILVTLASGEAGRIQAIRVHLEPVASPASSSPTSLTPALRQE